MLAILGVLALTEPWTGSVDVVGVGMGLANAVCWALYIVLSARVGGKFTGVKGLSVMLPVAAVVAGVADFPQAAGHITWEVLATATVAAVLVVAVSFSLDMLALRRIATSTLATIAAQPATGAMIGFLALGQVPTALGLVGTVLVVIAGVGVTRADAPATRSARSGAASDATRPRGLMYAAEPGRGATPAAVTSRPAVSRSWARPCGAARPDAGGPARRPHRPAVATGAALVARSGISLIATAARAATIAPDDTQVERLGDREAESAVDAFDDRRDVRLDHLPELGGHRREDRRAHIAHARQVVESSAPPALAWPKPAMTWAGTPAADSCGTSCP